VALLQKSAIVTKTRLAWYTAAHLEKCVTFANMRHSRKNEEHTWKTARGTLRKLHALGEMRHTWKCAPLVEKCTWKRAAHLKKMRHTCKNAPPLENFGTLAKLPHLEKCGTVKKDTVNLEKCATLGMHHIYKNAAHLEKYTTLGRMCHIWKSAAHLEKWVTLEKVRHTWKNVATMRRTRKCAAHLVK